MDEYPEPIDHAAVGVGRLLEQFKPKPKMNAAAAAPLGALADLEVVVSDLLTKRLLTAEGEQLNNLGRIFDITRGGRSDAAYLTLIMAAILTHRSSGTLPQIYAVLEAIDPTATFVEDDLELDAAALRIEWTDPPLPPIQAAADDVSASVLIQILRRARVAGVRLYFRWWPAAEAALFTLGADVSVLVTSAAHGLSDNAMTTGGVLVGEVVP